MRPADPYRLPTQVFRPLDASGTDDREDVPCLDVHDNTGVGTAHRHVQQRAADHGRVGRAALDRLDGYRAARVLLHHDVNAAIREVARSIAIRMGAFPAARRV